MSPILIVLFIATAVSSAQFPKCGPHAIWSSTLCTTLCVKTCANYQITPPPTCPYLCSKGCGCRNDEGYIRDTKTGQCVKPQGCSK
ncbi:cysteine-rich venom protein 6-like [Belonocnema kinseyi]|uniref:cysteine-rich venom protein 6-like n=1 Tax=Belonocnema kinseyi TaxID=2817044 RepID=UPI00143DA4F3|nr:cysteine-rich venom protein 6-like [Belonocnema kinseyi]